MEDQAEKMEALKKVYAEIILNTAKEAAARAMASERKALRVHHDLCNTKDEAVRMLLRLKQMIDVKTTEAETTALSQQKRIHDLDSQLNETEVVIMDLRAKIKNTHQRLDEMKNNHMLQSDEPSNDQTVKTQILPAKEIKTSDPNLASLIIGNKEPELYRNGYTHRIRAIERNLVDENETSSGKNDPSFIDHENTDAKNINGSETVSKDQVFKSQSLSNRVEYAESNHKLSRFCREKFDLKKKSCGNDAKLTESIENNACNLRRSVRKRKVRCWDEISSLFKSRASFSDCKKYSGNNGVKFEENNDSIMVEKHESAAKESVVIDCDDDNNRCLKYTFSRRRKKVLSSESYNCSSIGKRNLTGQMREKSSKNLVNEKLNLIDDSSTDSQNIIDVACQLISLSREPGR